MKPLLILLLLSIHHHASGQIENGTAAEPASVRKRSSRIHHQLRKGAAEGRRCTGIIIAANFAHYRRPLRHKIDREYPLNGSESERVNCRRGELAAGGGEGRKVLVRVAGERGRT